MLAYPGSLWYGFSLMRLWMERSTLKIDWTGVQRGPLQVPRMLLGRNEYTNERSMKKQKRDVEHKNNRCVVMSNEEASGRERQRHLLHLFIPDKRLNRVGEREREKRMHAMPRTRSRRATRSRNQVKHNVTDNGRRHRRQKHFAACAKQVGRDARLFKASSLQNHKRSETVL